MRHIFEAVKSLFSRAPAPAPEPTPQEEAVAWLAEFEGYYFSGLRKEKIKFVHPTHQVPLFFTPAEMPGIIDNLQKRERLLLDAREAGITEINVPLNVMFDSNNKVFTRRVFEKPRHRKPSDEFEEAYSKNGVMHFSEGWCVTRDSLPVDAVIAAYREVIEQFESGMREAMEMSAPLHGARHGL